MVAGFVHGVLNTDNINITGESFDYGPWRFAPEWDPGFTAAYFDHSGLYAFGRQPEAIQWNLAQLAGCLALLTDGHERLQASLEAFAEHFHAALAAGMVRRLGLAPARRPRRTAWSRGRRWRRWAREDGRDRPLLLRLARRRAAGWRWPMPIPRSTRWPTRSAIGAETAAMPIGRTKSPARC